jgi:hypothetical protein
VEQHGNDGKDEWQKRSVHTASYAYVYRLTTSKETNDKGTWYGWEVERVGQVEDAMTYAAAKTFALSVKQGEVNVKHENEGEMKDSSRVPF